MEHARKLALDLAEKEAKAELVCTFTATRCIRPDCSGIMYDPLCETKTSLVSFSDADSQALAAATQAASNFCAG